MPVSQIQLTTDGPTFSRLVPGLWRLDEWDMSASELADWIRGCLEMGATTFDNADIYGGYRCEELLGHALATDPALRAKMQIVTKCGIKLITDKRPEHWVNHYDTGREHIIWAAENSLRMMQTDHIDLLLIHRPDPLMDADEIAEAFAELKRAGKVLHFGVSNFTPSQFDLIQSRLPFSLVTNQVEFSVMYMDPMHDGIFDQLQRLRVAPMAWSPLGGGDLFTGQSEQAQRLRNKMQEIAAKYDADIDQIAIAWILAHPANVLPVLGTGKLDRVRKAVKAESIKLDRQDWFAIWVASKGHGVP
jgi:predicted oxidoreductase